jgi:hypothetical protein
MKRVLCWVVVALTVWASRAVAEGGDVIVDETVDNFGVYEALIKMAHTERTLYDLEPVRGIGIKKGLSVPVYTQPTKQSVRALDGRARVGLDSPFWVYGMNTYDPDTGWYVLILYDTSNGGRRFGYIDVKYVSAPQYVLNRRIDAQLPGGITHVLEDGTVTDDPYIYQTPLVSIKKGQRIVACGGLVINGQLWILVQGTRQTDHYGYQGFVKCEYLDESELEFLLPTLSQGAGVVSP